MGTLNFELLKEIFKDTHNFLDINGVSGVLLPND